MAEREQFCVDENIGRRVGSEENLSLPLAERSREGRRVGGVGWCRVLEILLILGLVAGLVKDWRCCKP